MPIRLVLDDFPTPLGMFRSHRERGSFLVGQLRPVPCDARPVEHHELPATRANAAQMRDQSAEIGFNRGLARMVAVDEQCDLAIARKRLERGCGRLQPYLSGLLGKLLESVRLPPSGGNIERVSVVSG